MQTVLSGTYKDMIANFESLQDQFDTKILEVGQYERKQQESPKTKTTNYLNKLKLERAKIKQILVEMETMTEAEILAVKETYNEDYKAAIKVLETAYGTK